MVDGSATTVEWQRHENGIVVLPIGSFEQHSAHLPLNTDIVIAEEFGRRVAAELDAALLPALPLGTCMEHTGFRGSISLRPETLMQVLRDVVSELERQHFRILIVLNAHGGNFALAPVVRDINRQDGSLKVLLVDALEFAPASPVQAPAHSQSSALREGEAPAEPSVEPSAQWPSQPITPAGLDIHAGEMETSVVLAIRPELVRADRMDTPVPSRPPLRQRDLNTFGIARMGRTGAIGYPSRASAAKGQAIVEAALRGLMDHLRDRIDRLEEEWRYAGPPPVAIRSLTRRDIPDGMRLKDLAGWNQVEADWELFLSTNPAGCFAALACGKVVGTVVSIRYGGAAWIGMMLVDPECRRMGIGTRLMEAVLESLAGCRPVGLDATPLGEPLYRKLGFVEQSRLVRLVRPGRAAPEEAAAGARSEAGAMARETALAQAMELDREAFGADRSDLFRNLYERDPGALRVEISGPSSGGNGGRAFCLGRRGALYTQIGPVAADRVEAAEDVIRAALQLHPDQPVVIDVPEAQPELREWLEGLGFQPQRTLIRMTLGSAALDGLPDQYFAAAGPELG